MEVVSPIVTVYSVMNRYIGVRTQADGSLLRITEFNADRKTVELALHAFADRHQLTVKKGVFGFSKPIFYVVPCEQNFWCVIKIDYRGVFRSSAPAASQEIAARAARNLANLNQGIYLAE